MTDTNRTSNPMAMPPSEIAQFVADCRTLIAHSRTFYEVRDALSKAVALIESNMRSVETTGDVEKERMRAALKLIAEPSCERLTSGPGSCWSEPTWSPEAQYGADKWCDACIALSALMPAAAAKRLPLEPTELPEALRDPIKNLERGRELLKEWGPTPVTDAALAESKESPLARAVRIARGDTGPPTEPVRFAEKASGEPYVNPHPGGFEE